MIEFFRGMAALDVIICCFAALIVISAVCLMAYIYIYERGKRDWQNEHDTTMR